MKKTKYLFYALLPMVLIGCSSSSGNPFDKSTPEQIAYDYLFVNKGCLYDEFTPVVLASIVGVSLARIGYKMFFPQANLGNDKGISLETFVIMILEIVIAIALWYALPSILNTIMGVS